MSEIDEERNKLNALLNSSVKSFNSSTISTVIALLERRDAIIQKWQTCSHPDAKEIIIDFLRTYNRDLRMILGL